MCDKKIIEKIALIEDTAFLGLGACGGNIVNEFEKLGRNTLYINSSLEDIHSLDGAKHWIHIKGGEGAFKNRDKAKQLVSETFEEIILSIVRQLTQQVIVVCFGMGGGTGSGIAPTLCNILANEYGKIVIPVGVLPDEREESILGCNNTLQCFAELEAIENLGTLFLLDNKKNDDMFKINKQFAKTLDKYLSTVNSDKQGNFDIGEKRFLLSQNGYGILTTVSAERSTALNIINSFRDNVFAPIENDKIIRYMGVSMPKPTTDIKELFHEVGEPLAHYTGYGSTSTVTIAVGMSYPSTRLKEIEDRVANNIDKVSRNMGANSDKLFAGKGNLLSGLLGNTAPKAPVQKKDATVSSNLRNKYLL